MLRMEGISKRFGRVVANDDVDFDVAEGEVHALLGENGAGKTTLMRILYGMCRPDAGTIRVNGRPVSINSPREALALGIGMVHQHFTLIPAFTAAENLALGFEPARHWYRPDQQVRDEMARLADQYGLAVDPDAHVSRLSLGLQQRVEILKALCRGARLLILDEPTAVLTPAEVRQLLENIRLLVARGHSIIFITHKLDEVTAFSDRVTVLRAGRQVATLRTADADAYLLARLMVGRDVLFRLERPPSAPGPPSLELRDLWIDDDRGRPAVRGVSIDVRAGEILGIAGVDGNGQRELAEAVYGLRRVERGVVRLMGQDVTDLPPADRQRLGMRDVPADRGREGLIRELSVAENLVLEDAHRFPFSRFGVLNGRAIERHAERLIDDFSIRASGPRAIADHLSGGNQQKVVLARTLDARPRVLICSQPTRGLDVGATEYVRGKLLDARASGTAVLLISTELDEIRGLSDRVGVLFRGELMGVLESERADLDTLGQMMAGVRATTASVS